MSSSMGYVARSMGFLPHTPYYILPATKGDVV